MAITPLQLASSKSQPTEISNDKADATVAYSNATVAYSNVSSETSTLTTPRTNGCWHNWLFPNRKTTEGIT